MPSEVHLTFARSLNLMRRALSLWFTVHFIHRQAGTRGRNRRSPSRGLAAQSRALLKLPSLLRHHLSLSRANARIGGNDRFHFLTRTPPPMPSPPASIVPTLAPAHLLQRPYLQTLAHIRCAPGSHPLVLLRQQQVHLLVLVP